LPDAAGDFAAAFGKIRGAGVEREVLGWRCHRGFLVRRAGDDGREKNGAEPFGFRPEG